MYSGITRGLFDVVHIEKKPGLITYAVHLNPELLADVEIGASVAIDGVCQTVIAMTENTLTFQAIQETLACTTLQYLYLGRKVSVERSLRYGEEIGGHEISGHVSGMAQVIAVTPQDEQIDLCLQCPVEWMKYIFHKGFIAVDGSSLTVNRVDPKGTFELHIIPQTLKLTNFGRKCVGDWVNIELDHRTTIIVSTVERILGAMQPLG